MPKVTVYIRNEDYEKWKAVEEKTELLHKALNLELGVPTSRRELARAVKDDDDWDIPDISENDLINGKAYARGNKAYEDSVKSCKHGADPKFCRYAKNGKPCK